MLFMNMISGTSNPLEVKNVDSKRYARIHVLFRVLAETKLGIPYIKADDSQKAQINKLATETKANFKALMGVDSLKNLDDEELKKLETVIQHKMENLIELNNVKHATY